MQQRSRGALGLKHIAPVTARQQPARRAAVQSSELGSQTGKRRASGASGASVQSEVPIRSSARLRSPAARPPAAALPWNQPPPAQQPHPAAEGAASPPGVALPWDKPALAQPGQHHAPAAAAAASPRLPPSLAAQPGRSATEAAQQSRPVPQQEHDPAAVHSALAALAASDQHRAQMLPPARQRQPDRHRLSSTAPHAAHPPLPSSPRSRQLDSAASGAETPHAAAAPAVSPLLRLGQQPGGLLAPRAGRAAAAHQHGVGASAGAAGHARPPTAAKSRLQVS